MALGWTHGFTFFPKGGSPFGRLSVPGQPDVDVVRAKLPAELQEQGACVEIRAWPNGGPIRLFVWEDDAASAVTETHPSERRARQRAEEVVAELLERRARMRGERGFR